MTDTRVSGRLVEPATVHRVHADTVFLREVRADDAGGYVATAVLPEDHGYYASHTAEANRRLDPMLVLEAVRQASIHLAHKFLGVAGDTHFLLDATALRVDADAFRRRPRGSCELTMTLADARPQRVGDRVRHFAPRYELAIDDIPIGEAELAVPLVPVAKYAALRRRRRSGEPPFSNTLPAPARHGALAPGAVGRLRAADVLLAELRVRPAGAEARLLVPGDHVELFDHPVEHVPGTLLIEAARQLGAALSEDPARAVLTAVRAGFHTFAELDEPVRLAAGWHGPELVVAARQGETEVATLTAVTEVP